MNQTNLFGEPEPERKPKAHRKPHDYPVKAAEVASMGEMYEDLELAAEMDLLERLRPKTRGDCADARKAIYADLPDGHATKEHAPCPWMRCRFHLHLDVSPTVVNGDDADLVTHHVEMNPRWTCALDVIDAINSQSDAMDADPEGEDDEESNGFSETARGDMADRSIAEALGVTDEWIRRTWNTALRKLKPRVRKMLSAKGKVRLEVLR